MPERSEPVVLVVEDDQDIAEIAADVLEDEGFSVVTASNGRRALSILNAVSPTVIVLDMMMPEVDGLAFLAEYGRWPEPRAPVLAVSAFDGYLPAAVAAGAHAALRKPYSIDALARTVAELAGGSSPSPAPVPVATDESARLRAILELALHDPSPTAALDEFVRRVARIFDVPIALVSIVTSDRQVWHSMCGVPEDLAAERGTPRSQSFCSHAVVARAALVVQDAATSALFRDNPLVRERGIRFYAGVPLFDRFGNALGTLCLVDARPRTFGHFDLELLSVLARRVIGELEWRDRRARSGAPVAAFRHLNHVDEELGILGRDAFVEALHVESLRDDAAGPLALAAVAVTPERLAAAVKALGDRFPAGHLGRLAAARVGVLARAEPDAAAAAIRALGPETQVSAAAVPRLLGGADVLLWSVEEALGDGGMAPPDR